MALGFSQLRFPDEWNLENELISFLGILTQTFGLFNLMLIYLIKNQKQKLKTI